MKKMDLFLEIVIVFLIFTTIFLSKDYLVGSLLLVAYLGYKYFTKRAVITAYKAAVAFNSKQYDKSLELYEKANNMHTATPNIKLRYAYAALYCGNLELCKKLLDSVKYEKLEQKLKVSYKQTEGLYLWKVGNIAEAIEIYKALHEEYEHTAVYESLGYLLILNNAYEDALEYNLKAYDYDSDSNVIADNLAQTYYFLGNIEKAKELYSDLFNKEDGKRPTFSEAFYYYGLILKDEGNIEDARYYLDKALDQRESTLSALTHNTIREVLATLDEAEVS